MSISNLPMITDRKLIMAIFLILFSKFFPFRYPPYDVEPVAVAPGMSAICRIPHVRARFQTPSQTPFQIHVPPSPAIHSVCFLFPCRPCQESKSQSWNLLLPHSRSSSSKPQQQALKPLKLTTGLPLERPPPVPFSPKFQFHFLYSPPQSGQSLEV